MTGNQMLATPKHGTLKVPRIQMAWRGNQGRRTNLTAVAFYNQKEGAQSGNESDTGKIKRHYGLHIWGV